MALALPVIFACAGCSVATRGDPSATTVADSHAPFRLADAVRAWQQGSRDEALAQVLAASAPDDESLILNPMTERIFVALAYEQRMELSVRDIRTAGAWRELMNASLAAAVAVAREDPQRSLRTIALIRRIGEIHADPSRGLLLLNSTIGKRLVKDADAARSESGLN